MTSPGGERSPQAMGGTETPFSPEYRIAQLPEEELEKLQSLEEELSQDTGKDVIVIAYEKERIQ
jgi:F420-0:gamma-glutamyl ligase-like protein